MRQIKKYIGKDRPLVCDTCVSLDQRRRELVPDSCDICDYRIDFEERHSRISVTNEQMMVNLWRDYHNKSVKKFELLYYDRK